MDHSSGAAQQGGEENYIDGFIEAAVELIDALFEKEMYSKRDTLVLPDCGRIAQVVQLLQEQNANDNVQILRRATQAIIEMRQQFINWKIIKKVVSENPSPRTIKQPSPLLAHFRPAIKQIPGPPIT